MPVDDTVTVDSSTQNLQNQTPPPASSSAYDPHSATPYTSPPPITAPPITAPPPTLDPSTSAQKNVRPVFGGGTKGTIGSIAYIGDAILRGAMKGREDRQQKEILKAKKLMDGFNYAKQQADAQILDMVQKPEVQSALDKRQNKKELNDDEKKLLTQYDQATSASDAAWQGLNQMQGRYLFGDQSKSKGKGKGGKKGEDTDPVAMASSSDPATKLRGIFMVREKLGNPIQYQVRDLLSKVQQQQSDPQYQLNQLITQHQQALAKGDTDTAKSLETRIESMRKEMSPYKPEPLDKKVGSYVGADGKEHVTMQRPDNSTYEILSSGDVRPQAGQIAKPGTFGEFESRVAQEAGIDVKNLSSESILQLQRAFSDAHKTGTVREGHYNYFNDKDGKIYSVPITTVTQAPSLNVPSVHPSKYSSEGTGANPPSDKPDKPGTQHTTKPQGHGGHAKTSATSSSDDLSGLPKGTRVIGNKETTDEKKIHAALIQTAEKSRSLSELLTTNEAYINAVHADHTKATPRQDLALIVAAVRAMNPGSVRLPQKELELELKAGSFGDRFRRQWEIASSGTIPDDQRDDLFRIVKNETTNFGRDVAKDWQQNFPNRPLPNHLKRYAQDTNQAPTKGDKKTYQGHEYTFDGTQWVRQ